MYFRVLEIILRIMVINLILYMFTLFNNTFYNAVVVVVVEGVFVKGISQ